MQLLDVDFEITIFDPNTRRQFLWPRLFPSCNAHTKIQNKTFLALFSILIFIFVYTVVF